MKKYIMMLLIIFLTSCSNVETFNKNETLLSFNVSKNMFLSEIKQNKKNEIDKFFISGIRNTIILKEIKKLNFKDFLIVIPNKNLEILEYNKIKSNLLIIYGTNTLYFDVIWKKQDNIWKIYSIYEKK